MKTIYRDSVKQLNENSWSRQHETTPWKQSTETAWNNENSRWRQHEATPWKQSMETAWNSENNLSRQRETTQWKQLIDTAWNNSVKTADRDSVFHPPRVKNWTVLLGTGRPPRLSQKKQLSTTPLNSIRQGPKLIWHRPCIDTWHRKSCDKLYKQLLIAVQCMLPGWPVIVTGRYVIWKHARLVTKVHWRWAVVVGG